MNAASPVLGHPVCGHGACHSTRPGCSLAARRIAFLLHYVTDISFGKLFFVVNLPFYRPAGRAWAASSRSKP
jgi:hypothetical protein